MFSSSQIKGVSSVEAYYAVLDGARITLSGVYTQTIETPAFSFSNATQPAYSSVLTAK